MYKFFCFTNYLPYFTLYLCLQVGIYAGDDESYTAFPTVFDEVIRRYHNVDVKTNKAVPEDYAPKSPPQLPPEGAKAIKSTRITKIALESTKITKMAWRRFEKLEKDMKRAWGSM